MNILCRNTRGIAGTQSNIARLHPSIRAKATQLVQAIEAAGIPVYIPDSGTYRTFAEQQAIYDKHDGSTKAKAGESWHNYGLAIDIVPVNGGYYAPKATYKKMGEIGKSLGWEWGGDWTSFKDWVHFQYTLGYKRTELYNMHQSGKVDANGYVLIGQSPSSPESNGESSSSTLPYIALAAFAVTAIIALTASKPQPRPMPYRYPPQLPQYQY